MDLASFLYGSLCLQTNICWRAIRSCQGVKRAPEESSVRTDVTTKDPEGGYSHNVWVCLFLYLWWLNVQRKKKDYKNSQKWGCLLWLHFLKRLVKCLTLGLWLEISIRSGQIIERVIVRTVSVKSSLCLTRMLVDFQHSHSIWATLCQN